MTALIEKIITAFDSLYCYWEDEKTHRTVSGLLVMIFIITLGAIELNRQELLPGFMATKIPHSHYMAINVAFTLVLILEVISLIFTLPCSLSKSLGKQFEILALIYLRNSFKQLSDLPEPIAVTIHDPVLWHILAYGGGAVAIFGFLGLYLHLLKKAKEPPKDGKSLYNFVAAKKTVAISLLVIFLFMAFYNGWLLLSHQRTFDFFHNFYTLLIFSDILLVLIAQVYLPQFQAVFRNSGYALATLLIRLALSAPVYHDVIIGIASALFAVLLTIISNYYYTPDNRAAKH
jgi:hypothetical protein